MFSSIDNILVSAMSRSSNQINSVIESGPVLYSKSSSNKPAASSSTNASHSSVISAPPMVSGPSFKTMASYFVNSDSNLSF